MTKVLKKNLALQIVAVCVALWAWPVSALDDLPQKPAEALYLQLGKVGLDRSQVYQVRGAALNRPGVQISLEDGTIAFTQDVLGHITGAFFEGDGEVLVTPPSEVERRSMSLFTGMAILEERFSTAYFRFNDDVPLELRPDLRAPSDAEEFVKRWDATAKNLALSDATRLLMNFSKMLPVGGGQGAEGRTEPKAAADRFLHARLQGNKFGVFDVFYDSTATEQVQAGQGKTTENGETYYDVWTSFSPAQAKPAQGTAVSTEPAGESGSENSIVFRRYTITTEVLPPKQIHARAEMECEVKGGGARTLLFELSRHLQIESVHADGRPVEFIHNLALEGTQLSRRGNDLVAVVLPEPARAGQKFDLEFVYGGDVLAEAGSGLLYVGERGTWYPNRGIEMADFDLEFSYPQGWTLVATGKSAAIDEGRAAKNGDQTSRWISERPIPLAGFNLGKYREATAKAGNVTVETYATREMERNFPSAPIQVIEPKPGDPPPRHPEVIIPHRPSPLQTEVMVGELAARAIQYYAERFGPFPYSHLALTQLPGPESQGWPGLVFLSSYAFLTEQEREQLHFEPSRARLQQSIPAHEVAHQWWGDLVTWNSYRDQWFSEGLANYCALLLVQERNPAGFREIMEQYRRGLVEKNKDGISPMEAGPVTLGTRLLSSQFPGGYQAISYGRGTWLFHMLRTMLKDAAAQEGQKIQYGSPEEPFMRGLRRVRQKYEGKTVTTRELLEVFAEDLPPSLRYEGKKSLDWFLDGWINGTSLPKLELKAVKITPQHSGTVVSGTILQKDAAENLVTSVPVYASVAGKQLVFLGRVFADGEETAFRLLGPVGARKIVLDPYETVLTQPK
ncbi:MAG TPA: M1 family aminopeptidase [Candidatus Sulfotelmatobacter sp.]|nr:M1 family aminopeptidase [Candidatus Sulfotelmatobacter sp.]